MKLSIIAAMDKKGGIGKDNKIPWHLRDDLIRLKTLTKDHVVILGRKTYDSMVWYYDRSGRPMPGKLYLVLTSDISYKSTRENAIVAHSLEEALDRAKNEDEVFINGGKHVFEEALKKDLVDKLYLTIVKGDFGADTFFPDYSSFKTKLFEQKGQSEGLKYTFLELTK